MGKMIPFNKLDENKISGKKIDIFINDEIIKGRIISVSKKAIKIVTNSNLNPEIREKIKCNFFYTNFFAQFTSEIKDVDTNILTIKLPDKIERLQLRESLRVPCNISCDLVDISIGKITNISTGGAYIKVHDNFSSKEHVNQVKNLFFTIENRDLKLKAKIIDEGNEYIRVKFEEVNEYIEDFIGDYCSRVDAAIFRGNKHDR